VSWEKITMLLTDEEYRALADLSTRELRSFPEQAHWLVRDGLRREGLLPAEPVKVEDQPQS
jgi:hypothetical protein